MSEKVLFLDDRSKRFAAAIKKYGAENVTLVSTIKECIKLICEQEWDIVSLDHDLGFGEYCSSVIPGTGMDVVRFFEEHRGFTPRVQKFVIHTTNTPAAGEMSFRLKGIFPGDAYPEPPYTVMGPETIIEPWQYDKQEYTVGIVAGAFDIIHPGYIRLFEDAKKVCGKLVVALNCNPPASKPRPVYSEEERKEILLAIKYVDEVVFYRSEEQLTEIYLSYPQAVRILGSDHEGKTTRPGLKVPVYYHERKHGWSATEIKRLAAASMERWDIRKDESDG